MFPLSDVLQHSYSDYMLYIWRKTRFIINPHDNSQLMWFWRHIAKNYDYKKFWDSLETQEKEAFIHFLSRFCYLPYAGRDQHIQSIEKKSMWIFKHPMGGFYIPVEFIKTLMNEKTLAKKNFLFSLLFRLKFREQMSLTALIRGTYDVSQVITDERNAWDMALVLYMLFANFHVVGLHDRRVAAKPNVLPIRSQFSVNGWHKPPVLYQPTPIWDYLYSEFPRLHHTLDEWRSLMEYGKKGFYRSLSLVSQPKESLVYLFASGHLIPILPNASRKGSLRLRGNYASTMYYEELRSRKKQMKNTNDTDQIKLVTPTELVFREESQSTRNQIRSLQ